MKKSAYFLIASVALIFTACSEIKPTAQYTYYVLRDGGKTKVENPSEVVADEKIYFTSTGEGNAFALWTGDASHDYSKRNDVIVADSNALLQRNSGIAMNKTSGGYIAEYVYVTRGDYKLTLVASQIEDFGKKVVTVVDDSKSIKVVDTAVTFYVKAETWFWTADKNNPKRKNIGVNKPCVISGDSLITYLPASIFKDNTTKPRTINYTFTLGRCAVTVNGVAAQEKENYMDIAGFQYDIVFTAPEGNFRKFKLHVVLTND